ncbi:hypothetical protein QJS64_05065 [Paraclostridium bifermentans]|uniref:Uncharacterized protein n=1 Tax=Paraclostridium bifermentans TaxID=1490 RepID=A0ABY8R746_PARBF|nr:hypothetical protein QJS64_05065 [Paraclostridium bifermentans]
MNNNEGSSSKLKELMNVILFAFSVIGAIVVLAYIYKDANGFDVMPLAFINQVIVYVSFLL